MKQKRRQLLWKNGDLPCLPMGKGPSWTKLRSHNRLSEMWPWKNKGIYCAFSFSRRSTTNCLSRPICFTWLFLVLDISGKSKVTCCLICFAWLVLLGCGVTLLLFLLVGGTMTIMKKSAVFSEGGEASFFLLPNFCYGAQAPHIIVMFVGIYVPLHTTYVLLRILRCSKSFLCQRF